MHINKYNGTVHPPPTWTGPISSLTTGIAFNGTAGSIHFIHETLTGTDSFDIEMKDRCYSIPGKIVQDMCRVPQWAGSAAAAIWAY